MRLSVVIPTYNRRPALARTLPTLFAQDFPPGDYEVVVAVDGSTDGTAEFLRGLHPPCSLRILEQKNQGQAVALNAGWRAAQGELILFLDDDILCDPGLLREHAAAQQDSLPRLAFGAIHLSPESPRTLAADWARQWTEDNLARLSRPDQPLWPYYAWVIPNSSLPRSVLVASGGFDERFTRRRLSADLGLQLWKMGVEFRYLPRGLAEQLYVKSARRLIRDDARWYGKNEIPLCRKHPEYRPFSALARLHEGPLSKRLFRELAVRSPVSPEPLLRPAFWAAELLRSIGWVRRAGIRLLQARMGIVTFRSAVREAGSWEAFRREFGLRLPVLLYHHVGPPAPGRGGWLTVPPEQFERQMAWLVRRGYTGIRSADWLGWCRDNKPLPARPVLLTFDDAYADLADYAFPILQRYNFGAAVFVVTEHVGGANVWDEARGGPTRRLLTAEQIRHWAARGIEFGAHSRTHRDLTAVSTAELEEQILGSGEDLARLLGTRPVAFAYPYGYSNQAVRAGVQRAFALAFTTEEGLNALHSDGYALRRTTVLPSDTPADLAARLWLGWSPLDRVRARVRRRERLEWFKRTLGRTP